MVLTSFWLRLLGIRKQSFGSSVINLYISFDLNKFLAQLPGLGNSPLVVVS